MLIFFMGMIQIYKQNAMHLKKIKAEGIDLFVGGNDPRNRYA